MYYVITDTLCFTFLKNRLNNPSRKAKHLDLFNIAAVLLLCPMMARLIAVVAILSLFLIQAEESDAASESCDVMVNDTRQARPPKFEAMRAIFEDELSIEDFFDSHFERSFMHIPDSMRSNRPRWMQHYRRFLPSADLDLILSHNASSTNSSASLALHQDFDVYRIANIKADFYVWAAVSVNPHLDSLRAAVRDGAVLHLYQMSSRSRQLAIFEDALRHFWAVPVSTTLSFHPPGTYVQPTPAPSLFAGDLFLVIIHGTAKAHLYNDYFPFPCSHHAANPYIGSLSSKNIPRPKIINMDEGDVLYIPRGTASDIRTIDSLALIVTFEVHTHQRLLFHGVLRAIDSMRSQSRLLSSPVSQEVGNQNKKETPHSAQPPKWADILKTAVNMAAEFTPAMRRYLPVAGPVQHVMEDLGMEIGAHLVRDTIGRFSRAAADALFSPMLEILANETEDVGLADRSVIKWAKQLWEGVDEDQNDAKKAFQASIHDLGMKSDAPSHVATKMAFDWSLQDTERLEYLHNREVSLRRHGQGDEHVPQQHCSGNE